MTNTDAIFEAIDRMNEVVADAIAWKRGRPDDDDLLQAMIRAEDDGDVLTDEELLANVVLLYLAGHETTVNLIGNGVAALLANRDQLDRLVADPSLDANAIEELLRYDSPVQFSRRIALEDFSFAGADVTAGELVMTPRRRQPRSRQVRRRRRPPRPGPRERPRARELRQRCPPLPGCGPRPPRGPGGDRSPRPPLPRHRRRRPRPAQRPDRPPRPRRAPRHPALTRGGPLLRTVSSVHGPRRERRGPTRRGSGGSRWPS